MTRIERIKPFIEALSDDAFEDFLAAATYAAGEATIYATLPGQEKAEIRAPRSPASTPARALPYDEVEARLDAKLKQPAKSRRTSILMPRRNWTSQIDYLIADNRHRAAPRISRRVAMDCSRSFLAAHPRTGKYILEMKIWETWIPGTA